MPVKSEAQRRLMEGIAHGDIPAGGSNPSQKVAKEFLDATPKGGKLPNKVTKAGPKSKVKKGKK